MRFPSKKIEQLIKDHGSMLEIERRKKHWVVKVDGKPVIVLGNSDASKVKYRTIKNTEAHLLRALREKGVDV